MTERMRERIRSGWECIIFSLSVEIEEKDFSSEIDV